MAQRLLLLLAAVALLALPASASAGVGRPVSFPLGVDDYGVEPAIGVNDRGDRVVAFTTAKGVHVAYSRHGSARFGRTRVVKVPHDPYGHERYAETPRVAMSPSGAALVVWRETDDS